MITALTFIIVFGLIVFVHELGHFTAAKLLKVKVHVFAFGFPPRIWSKKVGDTEYAINLIPFGGYVRLEGENEELEDKKSTSKKTDGSKSLLELKAPGLLLIYSAGVLMNVFAAFILVWLCFVIGFQPIDLGNYNQKIFPGVNNTSGIHSTVAIKVDQVETNTPAEKVGIRAGDKIIKVDNKNVYFTEDVIDEIQSKVTKNGATVDLTINRDGSTLEKTLSTYKAKVKLVDNQTVETNRIGVVLETDGNLKTNPINAIGVAAKTTWNIAKYTIYGIVDFFVKIFTQFRLTQNVVGPIGLVEVTNYFAQLGVMAVVQFAIILSISVALFNILPIPALDGGYVAFTLAELISKRKISLKTKNIIVMIGFLLIIALLVVVTFRDFITFDVWNFILKLFGR
jgi:regulator of sigma E protease